MAQVAVVQQPEHGKARRTAQVIGSDRVAASDRRAKFIQGEVRANNSMALTRPTSYPLFLQVRLLRPQGD